MGQEPGPVPPDDVADRRIGRVLQDRYRITGRIASGGMGIVYRAERVGLGRVVAVKFLHASMAREPNIQRRFEIEAQAMSRLSHPNCVGVLDFGVDELPYVVIDYVEGEPLDAVVMKGPLPPRRAIKIVRQILAALAHAHAQGIVHRDIKPENVVLERTPGLADHVRILDFGLAKLVGSDFGLTVGVAVGTPNYMAPEQMSEGPVDGRADLYAAGIVLFELLTGRLPFQAEELGEIFLRHLGTPPPKLREVAPARNFSGALEAVILRAMAKRPEERFASADAMAAALDEVPEAFTTPSPSPVPGKAAPAFPAAPAGEGHLTDATVPWSSDGHLLPVQAPGGGQAGVGVGLADWFAARPFRLAIVSGLASALLAGAMVMIGFAGRPRKVDAAASAGSAAADGADPRAMDAPRPKGAAPAVAARDAPREPARRPLVARTSSASEPGRSASERARGERTLAERDRGRGGRSPAEAVAAGRKAFEEGRFGAGLAAFREATSREPRRRGDAAILDPVIASLDSDKRGERAAFLRELGEPAVPALRAAARSHPKPRVRARAAELLPAPRRKPFLRWL